VGDGPLGALVAKVPSGPAGEAGRRDAVGLDGAEPGAQVGSRDRVQAGQAGGHGGDGVLREAGDVDDIGALDLTDAGELVAGDDGLRVGDVERLRRRTATTTTTRVRATASSVTAVKVARRPGLAKSVAARSRSRTPRVMTATARSWKRPERAYSA